MFPEVDTSTWQPVRDEQMGSKSKLWLIDHLAQRWLFKEPRPGHGEDWAEKVAAELASLLHLPHAVVELATFQTKPGIISLSVVPEEGDQLVHGNELLLRLDPGYAKASRNTFTVSAHTVSRVLEVIERLNVDPPSGDTPSDIESAADVFVGYLLFDAWIGNTDRHHENWAVISSQNHLTLAPTYDHGSSMGRNEPDARRMKRLETRDANQTVVAYCQRAPSRFFATEKDKKPLHPLSVFQLAAQHSPVAAKTWLNQLRSVTDKQISEIIDQIPPHRMSNPARLFASAILTHNRLALLNPTP